MHGSGLTSSFLARAWSSPVEAAIASVNAFGAERQFVGVFPAKTVRTCHTVLARVAVSGPVSAVSRSRGTSSAVTFRSQTSRYTMVEPTWDTSSGDSPGRSGCAVNGTACSFSHRIPST